MSSRGSKILRHCVLVLGFLAPVASVMVPAHQASGKVDFRRDVQPIFKQFCIECHGSSRQMHGFRLDRRRDAMRGGTVTVIARGNSAASRLYLRLIGKEFGQQMPPTGPLAQEQIEIIKAWIDQGAEWPDDLAGDTPPLPPDPKAAAIFRVLRDGDNLAFKRSISQDPTIVNVRGPDGTTPLMLAALYGDLESVELLLGKGADPNLRNEAGATALMWAVDDLEKTRLLVDHGAQVNAQSDDGRTPLLIAAGMFGNTDVVKLLLGHGADISARSPDPRGYATVLSEAARTGDESLLRMLIQYGADVNIGGALALANAERAKCARCLELLMDRADRRTLTDAAIALSPPSGNARGVESLVSRGVDANSRDRKGNTLLMLAASSSAMPVETVNALLKRHADVNATNPEGKTALDFARLIGSTPIVDILVNAGAKPGTPATYITPNPKPAASPQTALERTIPLLQKADAIFLQKASCVSCHNNTFTSMTVSFARKNGFKVDEHQAHDRQKKVGALIEVWRERALQGVGIPGESTSISYILLGLAAENYPSDQVTDALARFLKSQQSPDGGWRSFGHRPPMASADIQVTAASIASLKAYGLKAHRSQYDQAVSRAADWLTKAQPRTTDERVFQLLGLVWAGTRPDSEIIRNRALELLAEQRADGGWAQLPSLASDAYATGQALVALRQSGAVRAADPAYKRGIQFLLKTQLEDGSWYIRSRVIPLQPYFEGGFPYGRDQWISVAGTNWAAMALALSSDGVKK